MNDELKRINEELDEILIECECDAEDIKELEKLLKKIEHALRYCQMGDW